MNDEIIINKILAEYEEKRIKAAAERKKRIEYVNNNFPDIKEIDREIFKLGFENMNSIFKNPENKDKLNNEFKEKLNILNNKKNKILKDNNIDIDYDKYKYECEICSDTGYDSNGKKCKCLKQRMIDEAYSMSNMQDMIKEQNFENFSLDYYSDKELSNGVIPRENMKKIYDRCKTFCDNFDNEKKSILFFGAAGLGKTFLSSSIAKRIMDSGKTVVYLRASKLFVLCEDIKYGRMTDRSIIDNIYNCDLFIIDDLGTEVDSINNISFLLDIMNERITTGKKMIINTNFNIKELIKMYSNRFTSRLYEYFNIYKFEGEDIRLQKLKSK